MKAVILSAAIALVSLGCASPEATTGDLITRIQQATEKLDANRAREINAARRTIRAQCGVLRLFDRNARLSCDVKDCASPAHLLSGVNLDAQCLPYESGVLAGSVVPIKFSEEDGGSE